MGLRSNGQPFCPLSKPQTSIIKRDVTQQIFKPFFQHTTQHNRVFTPVFASMATTESSLPYHEPSITTIIILSGFLLLLNGVNYGLDKLVYCGLVGQVFLGIAWGTPGAKWLSGEMEHSMVQLGYLGLILIVFEGELSHV